MSFVREQAEEWREGDVGRWRELCQAVREEAVAGTDQKPHYKCGF
ncbi:hypothetical protein CLOHYLEM_06817 [[Clostridium] hylemonae DSM 15053]|uniref:Uncharacterized protein n=1 Tax=[Clostridium] hylemonae DSM 15053 TaxID=553973 RepID=C0C404_9FIRM|nr:hypothetical protein CLOHYLEM_06817 [[Clostridium] hylemonae DSM 15053]